MNRAFVNTASYNRPGLNCPLRGKGKMRCGGEQNRGVAG